MLQAETIRWRVLYATALLEKNAGIRGFLKNPEDIRSTPSTIVLI